MRNYFLENTEIKALWNNRGVCPYTYLKKKNLGYVYVASLHFLYRFKTEHYVDI